MTDPPGTPDPPPAPSPARASLDELERSLRASWNTDDLAVYADHLQALGDPRGELIALDLAPRDEPAWRARRRAVLEARRGPELAARAGRLVRHGFLHELRAGPHAELLDGPLGAFVRGFTIEAETLRTDEPNDATPPTAAFAAALARLAARVRPWLTRLEIHAPPGWQCPPELREQLIWATPNLVEVFAPRADMLASFRHPSLRRLYVAHISTSPPDTDAEVIELPGLLNYLPFTRASVHTPTLSRSADDRDLEAVAALLEAIEATADCNELAASHGDLVQPQDTLPAFLMRLDEAGLVALEGPFATLTDRGRALIRHRARRFRPATDDLGGADGVFWISCADPQVLLVVTWLSLHRRAIAAVQHLPLDAAAHAAVCDYADRLRDLAGAPEDVGVELTTDVPALAAALRLVPAYRGMGVYVGLHGHAWGTIEQLADYLEKLGRPARPPHLGIAIDDPNPDPDPEADPDPDPEAEAAAA